MTRFSSLLASALILLPVATACAAAAEPAALFEAKTVADRDSALAALETAAPSDPAPVRLDVELTVEAAGSVGKLSLGGDAPQAMRDCARNAIAAWHFPAATAPTDVRFPMVFQPNIVRQ